MGTLLRALKRSTSIDFPHRHAIGPRWPDGVVVRKVYRGRQPPTGPAKYASMVPKRQDSRGYDLVTSVHPAASACHSGGVGGTYGTPMEFSIGRFICQIATVKWYPYDTLW